MKKRKIKKMVSKMLGQELAAYDSRINDLEINAGIKFFEIRPDTFTKGYLGAIAVKDAEHITVVSKTEITELSETWCILRTKTNYEAINEWVNTKFDKQFSSYGGYMTCFGGVYHIRPTGYTKISFSDFERLVLKKEQIGNSEQLEAGKWYIYPTGAIQFNVRNGEGYGLNALKEWVNDAVWLLVEGGFRLATNGEVEDALKTYAERKGFREGVTAKFNTPFFINHGKSKFDFFADENKLTYINEDIGYRWSIFDNGIWAEIISQPEENIQEVDFEIDFSVPGQLLRDADGFIVFTSGLHDNLHFEASIIQGPLSVGKYATLLNKSEFKLFNGSIGLKN